MRIAPFAAAIAFVALAAAPALAQPPGVPVAHPAPPAAEPRVNQVIVYGNDPCPASTDADEITVCARFREEDRYRIPPNLRDNPNAAANQSWTNRATELAYVGRTGTDSCSTAGPGGFTGCLNQIINHAQAERRAAGDVNWTRMVEEARRDREARLRAEAHEGDQQHQEPFVPPATPH
jgi:hypothetical protein